MAKRIAIFSCLCLLFLGILFATAIIAQGITVYSDVDSTNIGIDEQVSLRLTIAGSGFFKTPDLPKIPDFSVIITKQFTGMDFSKGKPVPYTVFEYMFMPHRKGILEIPAIAVNYKGYYYASSKYSITVGDKLRKVSRSESSIPFRAFQGRADSSAIFVQSSISKKDCFYNQQLVYTYTIYTSLPIKKLPQIQIPEYEAFHREPLYYKKEYLTEIQGTTYRAFEFKFSLFPFMTDNQTIPPIRMIVRPTDFPNSPFDSAFVKQSQAFTVNVQDLPLKDKPLSFSGLVGKFDVSSEVESKEVGVEDYVVLTVRVKGNGNVRSIPHIKCPLMDNLREYNSDVFMNFDKKEAVTAGEKLFKFALLPREKGIETIPSVGFSYFDEDQGTYVTKWTDPIEIKIVKKAKKDDAKEGKPKKKTNFMFLVYVVGAVVFGFVGFVFLRARS